MTLALYVWYCLLYLHPVCSFDLSWLTHAVRGTGTARAIRWHWRVFVKERIGQRLGWKVRWWQPDGTSQSDDVVVQVQSARGFACEPRPNSAATKACPPPLSFVGPPAVSLDDEAEVERNGHFYMACGCDTLHTWCHRRCLYDCIVYHHLCLMVWMKVDFHDRFC